jgi:hypothetical protein
LNRHSLRTALMTALVVTAGACSDQTITSSAAPTPVVPPVNASEAGMLRGTVREDGTLYFESLDPSIQVGDTNTTGAIYGNQNVTAKVTSSNFVLTNDGTTKTWTFKLAVHNLLNFPVGSIDGAAAPYDTVGMFVFFPSQPSVVSPSPCSCTINVLNTQGTGSFTNPGQPYYWYHDRLAAKGQAGDSTKNNPTFTFTAPSKVVSFRFTILLSSPWARGLQTQDTSWTVNYSATVLPSAATPIWKSIGMNFGGTHTASSSGLFLSVAHSGTPQDQFYYRSDNLNRTDKSYMETRATLVTSVTTTPVLVLALVDSVRFTGFGIANNHIGFVTFNETSLQWQFTGILLSSGVNTTGSHVYRVAKFGADSTVLYMDGVARLSALDRVLPANFMTAYGGYIGAQAAKLSTFFGITAQGGDGSATVAYVNYGFHLKPTPSPAVNNVRDRNVLAHASSFW